MRKPTRYELQAAIFLIGVSKAFKLRGIPSSMPRSVFFSSVNVALELTWKLASISDLGSDETNVKRMVDMAKELGFDLVATNTGCEWVYDEHHFKWDTNCGGGYIYEHEPGGFCPNCGRDVLVAQEGTTQVNESDGE